MVRAANQLPCRIISFGVTYHYSGATIALLLSWSAIYYVVSESLPPIAEVTRMDGFMMFGFCFITAIAVGHVAATHLKSKPSKRQTLDKLNAWLRTIAVPIVIVAALVTFDWSVLVIVVLSFGTFSSLVCAAYVQRKKMFPDHYSNDPSKSTDAEDWAAKNPLREQRASRVEMATINQS